MKNYGLTKRYYCLECDYDTDTIEMKGKSRLNKCPKCKRKFLLRFVHKEYNTT